MADVITRFKLETTQYDSRLRDATKSLAEYTRRAAFAGSEFGKFTKSNIDAARAIAGITPSATNAKDKVKELVSAFNDTARAYNALTKEQQQSDFGRALADSIGQLSQKVKQAKQELYGLGDEIKKTGGGGSFLSEMGGKLDGMLQVFGGNLMTKGAGMLAGLAGEVTDMVKQGIELAKSGEGVRMAFERLGRGDILDGLRQATHGTVTDLELMKAAVKFNDFKLPVEELGTMLAFAQQKAKDTGQSVDYMVDSIVTGLGRKSLMILDNLGLSAAEIKDKMAETGDMTKAVGAIIREQMAKAGDYVETAADRAAQADVQLKNAMEQLGRTFQPLSDVGVGAFNTLKISALNLLNSAIKPLINALTTAGALRQEVERRGGNERIAQDVKWIANSDDKNRSYNNLLQGYMQEEMKALNALKEAQKGGRGSIGIYEKEYNAAKQLREDFQKAVKPILEPVTVNINTEGAEQSIDSLKVKLVELEAQRKKAIAAGDAELSKNLAKQITQTKADIKGLGGTTTTHKAKPKTEEQQNAARISELVKQYQDLATAAKTADDAQKAGLTERMAKIQGEIKILQDRNDELKKFADGAKMVLPEGSLKSLQAEMTSLRNAQQLVTNPSEWQDYEDAIKKVTNQIKELKGELSNIEAGNMASLAKIEGVSLIDMAAGRVKGKGMKDLGLGEVPTRESIIAKGQKQIQNSKGVESKEKTEVKLTDIMGQVSSGISSMVGGIEQLGIDIPQGMKEMLGGLQAITSFLSAITTIVSAIQAITAADTIIPFAGGGIVGRAAGGMLIPGTSFSGDRLRMPVAGGRGAIGVNSGEVILNRAQQGVLAEELQGGGGQGVPMQPYVDGEKIFLGMNNTSKRMGRGEIVTTSTLRRYGLI